LNIYFLDDFHGSDAMIMLFEDNEIIWAFRIWETVEEIYYLYGISSTATSSSKI
jgi:hypothetical protein